MKESLEGEFAKVYELCEFILTRSTRPQLLNTTLQTLQRFITWIPHNYIFNTGLVVMLADKVSCVLSVQLLSVIVMNSATARTDTAAHCCQCHTATAVYCISSDYYCCSQYSC
jgi:Exportin 1-like protein